MENLCERAPKESFLEYAITYEKHNWNCLTQLEEMVKENHNHSSLAVICNKKLVMVHQLHKLQETYLLLFNDHEKTNLMFNLIKDHYDKALLLVPPKATIEYSVVVLIHMEEEKHPILASKTFIQVSNAQLVVASMFDAHYSTNANSNYSTRPIQIVHSAH